jgi:hypothetical protein
VELLEGVVQFAGGGLQALEVAGADLGAGSLPTANAGNFGIGRLVVGANGEKTRLNLLELIDNGNRGNGDVEALYLYGIGGADGLDILAGSTLHIASNAHVLDVYARVNGSVVNLNSLLPGPNSTVAFGDGFLSNELIGDFNVDDNVDATDIDNLCGQIQAGDNDILFDLNLDGIVTEEDLNDLLGSVLMTGIGDANLDGAIDLSDLNVVRNNFGSAGGWASGNFDCSPAVDLPDLNAVRNNFGFTRTVPVPEPASSVLLIFTSAIIGVRYARSNARGLAIRD